MTINKNIRRILASSISRSRLFSTLVMTVRATAAKHEPFCRPMATGEEPWFAVLGQRIFEFWTAVGCTITRKNANTHAAVGLSLIARPEGYEANGVVYVRHSPVVAAVCIADVQFGRFAGITCRRMSILYREMIGKLQTQTGQQRIIAPLALDAGI